MGLSVLALTLLIVPLVRELLPNHVTKLSSSSPRRGGCCGCYSENKRVLTTYIVIIALSVFLAVAGILRVDRLAVVGTMLAMVVGLTVVIGVPRCGKKSDDDRNEVGEDIMYMNWFIDV